MTAVILSYCLTLKAGTARAFLRELHQLVTLEYAHPMPGTHADQLRIEASADDAAYLEAILAEDGRVQAFTIEG